MAEQQRTGNGGAAAGDARLGADAVARPKDVLAAARRCIEQRGLANAETPVLLMVSGGSDSTALAYVARQLADEGAIGPIAMLHVNHRLRPGAADQDEAFTAQLAELLGIPLFSCQIDVAGQAQREGGNVEAVAASATSPPTRRLQACAAMPPRLCPRAASSPPTPPTIAWRTSTCAPWWALGRAASAP